MLVAKHCTADSAEHMNGTALHSAYYLALGAAGALLRCQHLPARLMIADILRQPLKTPQVCSCVVVGRSCILRRL